MELSKARMESRQGKRRKRRRKKREEIEKGEGQMPLYNRLKEYRARLEVNQAEMGKLAGVSRQTISLIERGDYAPSVALALKLAAICQAQVEDIFWDEEEGKEEGENHEC